MMTKKQFAKAIIAQKRKELNIPNELQDTELHNYAYQSTCLGIALEELGFLDSYDVDLKIYLANRSGILNQYIYVEDCKDNPQVSFLTMRDILSMLPDTIEEEK